VNGSMDWRFHRREVPSWMGQYFKGWLVEEKEKEGEGVERASGIQWSVPIIVSRKGEKRVWG